MKKFVKRWYIGFPPLAYSDAFSPIPLRAAFPLEGRGSNIPRRTRNTVPHGIEQSQITRQNKVEDEITPPGTWSTSGPLSRGCSQSPGRTSPIFPGTL